MDLRVEYLDPFYDSLWLLDNSPKTFRALVVLLSDATKEPETVPRLKGTNMRVAMTTPDSGLVLLRVFFFIEDGVMKIMEVEPYEEWEFYATNSN